MQYGCLGVADALVRMDANSYGFYANRLYNMETQISTARKSEFVSYKFSQEIWHCLNKTHRRCRCEWHFAVLAPVTGNDRKKIYWAVKKKWHNFYSVINFIQGCINEILLLFHWLHSNIKLQNSHLQYVVSQHKPLQLNLSEYIVEIPDVLKKGVWKFNLTKRDNYSK